MCPVDPPRDPESYPAMRFVPWFPLVAALWACTPQAAVPPQAPQTTPAKPGSNWKQVEPAKQKRSLVPEPSGVPPADAACQALLAHPVQGCNKDGAERDTLATALTVKDANEQDAQLACLESSAAFPPGLVRALRADRAPLGCADVLSLPFLEPRRADLDRSVEDTLLALAVAGRLSRLVQKAPELSPPFDKAHFMEFFGATLKPWIISQTGAIHDLAQAGPRLSPYAKGVIAIEAGLADMRFVSVVRRVALPKEMSDDPEVRDAYYAALDEALEPRKARGRDAALVGLRELSNEGVLVDARVDRARALLSEVFAGRRIDALDQLLLPPLRPADESSTEQRLAARLPTFYANLVLGSAASDVHLLRSFLERGLPRQWSTKLDPAQLDDSSRDLFARALIEHGRRYFRAEDFAAAARLTLPPKPSPDRALYQALSLALQNATRDATELLLGSGLKPIGASEVAELDLLAKQKSNPNAPLAAFDSAYLLQLSPPQNDPKFWDDLARRFALAESALKEPARKQLARESSSAAKDTAKALRKTLATPAARP